MKLGTIIRLHLAASRAAAPARSPVAPPTPRSPIDRSRVLDAREDALFAKVREHAARAKPLEYPVLHSGQPNLDVAPRLLEFRRNATHGRVRRANGTVDGAPTAEPLTAAEVSGFDNYALGASGPG